MCLLNDYYHSVIMSRKSPKSLLSLSFKVCVEHALQVYEAIPSFIANEQFLLLPGTFLCNYAHKTGEYDRMLRLAMNTHVCDLAYDDVCELLTDTYYRRWTFQEVLDVVMYIQTYRGEEDILPFEHTKAVITNVCSFCDDLIKEPKPVPKRTMCKFCVKNLKNYKEFHMLIDEPDEMVDVILDMRNYCSACWTPLYKFCEWIMDDYLFLI
ncbi:ORF143a [Spodoptera frugiperda granulovirus]|uniref:ORF143a n=1 Tax=Spodoptera frugiperda granulovirus TaxID=307454 RepID=A0A0C5AS91_9BBAC|nr:ORF143a [Spodoptera frugiperda granulovirus]AJK91804.1 ORF143a [Spodoptera frugiperda granulovirus]